MKKGNFILISAFLFSFAAFAEDMSTSLTKTYAFEFPDLQLWSWTMVDYDNKGWQEFTNELNLGPRKKLLNEKLYPSLMVPFKRQINESGDDYADRFYVGNAAASLEYSISTKEVSWFSMPVRARYYFGTDEMKRQANDGSYGRSMELRVKPTASFEPNSKWSFVVQPRYYFFKNTSGQFELKEPIRDVGQAAALPEGAVEEKPAKVAVNSPDTHLFLPILGATYNINQKVGIDLAQVQERYFFTDGTSASLAKNYTELGVTWSVSKKLIVNPFVDFVWNEHGTDKTATGKTAVAGSLYLFTYF